MDIKPCTRCGGVTHEERIEYTDIVQDICFSCGDVTDSLIILNRLYPEYSPPKSPILPGTPRYLKLTLSALDQLEDDVKHGHGYHASVADIAQTIGVRSQYVAKIRQRRNKLKKVSRPTPS